jgi:hypothetical protein
VDSRTAPPARARVVSFHGIDADEVLPECTMSSATTMSHAPLFAQPLATA